MRPSSLSLRRRCLLSLGVWAASASCSLGTQAFLVPSALPRNSAVAVRMMMMSTAAPHTLLNFAGQDPGELFDLCAAPSKLGVIPREESRLLGSTKPRKLVHRDGDWHRAVHVWLVNSKGEMLLQERSPHKDTFPGMLDVSVGGHITAGDDSLATAVKETREELGLQVSADELKFVFSIATSSEGSTEAHGAFRDNELKDLYLCNFEGSEQDLSFSPDEVTAVKWMKCSSVRKSLEEKHPDFIPRSEEYIAALFAAIDDSGIIGNDSASSAS